MEAAVASQVLLLRTISRLYQGGIEAYFGLCRSSPEFYTASGVESYEYDHGPITEILACQN